MEVEPINFEQIRDLARQAQNVITDRAENAGVVVIVVNKMDIDDAIYVGGNLSLSDAIRVVQRAPGFMWLKPDLGGV